MRGKNIKEKIENRFNMRFDKIIIYKNPNEFTSMYIERINPNHVGIVWGRRHKKFNKGTHYVRCAKVFFSWIPVALGLSVLGWFDVVVGWIYDGLINIGLFGLILGLTLSFFIWYVPIWFNDRHKVCPVCKRSLTS